MKGCECCLDVAKNVNSGRVPQRIAEAVFLCGSCKLLLGNVLVSYLSLDCRVLTCRLFGHTNGIGEVMSLLNGCLTMHCPFFLKNARSVIHFSRNGMHLLRIVSVNPNDWVQFFAVARMS